MSTAGLFTPESLVNLSDLWSLSYSPLQSTNVARFHFLAWWHGVTAGGADADMPCDPQSASMCTTTGGCWDWEPPTTPPWKVSPQVRGGGVEMCRRWVFTHTVRTESIQGVLSSDCVYGLVYWHHLELLALSVDRGLHDIKRWSTVGPEQIFLLEVAK